MSRFIGSAVSGAFIAMGLIIVSDELFTVRVMFAVVVIAVGTTLGAMITHWRPK